jgi:hypothetical protein
MSLTALNVAVYSGKLPLVKGLVEYGADVNAVSINSYGLYFKTWLKLHIVFSLEVLRCICVRVMVDILIFATI